MKRAIRLHLTGNLQSMFFKQNIKEQADIHEVAGFIRSLSNGKTEIFLEGQSEDVSSMIRICKESPKYAQVRNVEEKEEKLQDFKGFKILSI